MINCFYVYLLLDPRRLYLPFYVGKGKGKRWMDHLKDRNGKNHLKKAVIRKIKEAGLEPTVLLWEQNLTEDRAFGLERELISKFGRRNLGKGLLTNLTDGGEGVRGKVFTEKEKIAISNRTKGARNPMYGKTHSQEIRNIISEAQKNKAPFSHSEKWRQHLRENNAGGKATARPIYQIDSNGQVIKEWPSAKAASEALNITRSNLSANIKTNNYRRCGGFWWRWVDSKDVKDGVLINHKDLTEKLKKPRAQKPIIQIDPSTQRIVTKWSSFQEAANHYKLEYGTLWAAVKHRRNYRGWLWKRA